VAFFWTGSSILPRLHQPAHDREPSGSRSVSPGASVVADGLGDVAAFIVRLGKNVLDNPECQRVDIRVDTLINLEDVAKYIGWMGQNCT